MVGLINCVRLPSPAITKWASRVPERERRKWGPTAYREAALTNGADLCMEEAKMSFSLV